MVDILVDDGLIFDFLGPCGEFERLVRLTVAVGGRRHHRNHGCLTIATKRVLEKPCQL